MNRRRRYVIGVVLCAAVAALLWANHVAVLRGMVWWLDVGQRPHRSDYVMVLTGDEQTRPFAGAALIRAHFADRALITRVAASPKDAATIVLDSTEISRRVLVARGVKPSQISILPGAAKTTLDEAGALSAFLEGHPSVTVLVVTDSFHTRRSRWIFQSVLGQRASQVAFVSAPTDEFDLNFWWRDQRGVAVIGAEYLKFAAYLVYYGHFFRWLGACILLAVAALWAAKRLRRRLKVLCRNASLAALLLGIVLGSADSAAGGAVPLGDVSNVTVINDGNYNAFPGITSLPNGGLIVVYRAGTNHVSAGATVNYTVSEDGGETWSAPQVLATPPGGSEYRDTEIATLSDGSVRVSTFLLNNATGAGYTFIISGTYNSSTNSLTWAARVPVATGFPGGRGGCSGKVIELADGALLLPIYDDAGSAVVRSTDRGRTWGGFVMTATRNYSEPNGVVEPNGEIVLFLRNDSAATGYGVWRTVSTDEGQTWSTPTQVLGGHCVDALTRAPIVGYAGRPSPVLLPSGAIVMLNRAGSRATAGHDNYWTSWDGGLTWTEGNLLAESARQMYGSLALLPDGEVAGVSAYTALDWTPDREYAAGDTVLKGETYYQCLAAHTSGPAFDATEERDWRQIPGVACGVYYQNFVDRYSLGTLPSLPGETGRVRWRKRLGIGCIGRDRPAGGARRRPFRGRH